MEGFERMMTQTKGFHIVRRPEEIVSQFERIVVDGQGHPHLALTRLYQQLRQELSDGTAHTYLQALLRKHSRGRARLPASAVAL